MNEQALKERLKKSRKQAEFLVYQSFPAGRIEKIGVYSQERKVAVESILKLYNYTSLVINFFAPAFVMSLLGLPPLPIIFPSLSSIELIF